MVHDLNSDMAVRLVISALLGGLIGLEREVHGRSAGFRTHLLVSLGSCLYALASLYIYRIYGNFSGAMPIGVDPGRIAAQIVTGIGFLGAGAIIRERTSIRGLTTAACLWVAAGIGLSCGIGMFLTAFLVTVLSLFSLLLLKRVELRLGRDAYTAIKVWSSDRTGQKQRIEQLLLESELMLVNVAVERNVEAGELLLEYQAKYNTRGHLEALSENLSSVEGVKKVRIE
ncbi:MgtC/SapB family protein [Geobacter sp. DSM 9736]|uniref:MgtC/SapB family protein n=1 Tax=Geobacter sp. DSM 9736 TaxID=1277350 RepID=UPI000B50E45C|nr:MgtC/SapB family protein [Geobacter sp. DSM 9736]SNB45727.1 putative Mg2+ transporter-C (MgtC) family protein [Geobacter sp. DSM 9736]